MMVRPQYPPERDPENVAFRLIENARIPRRERRYPAPGVSLADVEVSVERFVRQDSVLHERDVRVPALLDTHGQPIPIDIGLPRQIDGLAETDVDPELVIILVRTAATSTDDRAQRIELVSTEQARESFTSRLIRFLGLRINDVEGSSEGSPGYVFKVYTNSHSLRIHYSPAYFINYNLAFGSPTTPVSGYLQPGRYTFGAYPNDYWDGVEYDIPGPQHSAHMAV